MPIHVNNMGLRSKIYLQRQLHSLNLQVDIDDVLGSVQQLKGVGKEILDDDLIAKILASLQNWFGPLINAMEQKKSMDL